MLFNNKSSGMIFLVIVLMLFPCLSFSQDFTFSTDIPTNLNGTYYFSYQTVLYSAGNYSLAFDGATSGMTDDININALTELPSGNMLFSIDTTYDDGKTIYEPRDILEWNGSFISMYQSGAALGLRAEANINALGLDSSGNVLLSFDVPETPASITFKASDIAVLNAGTLAMYFQGQANGMPAGSNICGFHVDCAGNYLFNFESPVQLSGTWFHPTEIVSYDGVNYSLYFSDLAWAETSGMTDFYLSGTTATLSPASDSPQCLGTQIQFSANRTGGTSPYSYNWDFGDGSGSSTAENPSYTYTAPGTYTASVTMTDGSGCPVGPEITVVTIYENPNVSFSWIDNADCTVSFADTTTGGATPYTYSWDFGDGSGTSTAQNPTYTYASNGTYTVTLNINDNNSCVGSYVDSAVAVSGCGGGSGVGEVPDNDDFPGNPVEAQKSGNDVVITHDAASGATHYNLYRGTIASLQSGAYDHNTRVNSEACNGDNSGDGTLEDVNGLVEIGDFYYLVSGNDTACEGSYGDDSSNTERPVSTDNCGLILCP